MTPEELIAQLSAKGVIIIPDGDRLRLRPKSRLSQADHVALLMFKTDILQILAGPRVRRDAYAWPWPDELPRLGRRTIGPFDACTSCEQWSWVRYGHVVLCLRCATATSSDASANVPSGEVAP
jgi:hypothetical protein